VVPVGAGGGLVESHRRTPPVLGVHIGGVFAHVVTSGFYPDGVVHGSIYDAIGAVFF
jgi:hypothetical protein